MQNVSKATNPTPGIALIEAQGRDPSRRCRPGHSRCGPASRSVTWPARSRTFQYPLLLLSFGVPAWVVTRGFGHNDMYWHRLVERFGRNSLAGVTARNPGDPAAAPGGR